MVSAATRTRTRTRKAAPAARRPTEYLFQSDSDQLSPVMVYRLTVKGFVLALMEN